MQIHASSATLAATPFDGGHWLEPSVRSDLEQQWGFSGCGLNRLAPCAVQMRLYPSPQRPKSSQRPRSSGDLCDSRSGIVQTTREGRHEIKRIGSGEPLPPVSFLLPFSCYLTVNRPLLPLKLHTGCNIAAEAGIQHDCSR